MVQNAEIIKAVPFFEGKQKYLQYLSSKEDVMSWTGIITGPFFDWVSITQIPRYFNKKKD